MTAALILCILVFAALVGVLMWMLVRSQRRYDDLLVRYVAASESYAGSAIRSAAEQARNAPKQADKMLDSVARSITDVTEAVRGAMTDSMRAMYGPVQAADQAQADRLADLPTPWYAAEGSADYTDPTDAFLGGISDPIADNNQAAGGNLLLEDGPGGFGLPEGAFD